MKHYYIEVFVGLFLVIGMASFSYLCVKFAKMEIVGGNYYTLSAEFDSVSGLKNGADVEIAGVKVGKVSSIALKEDTAVVQLSIMDDIEIQDDAIASIRTRGIIGDKFLSISPGGSDEIIKENGTIRETESPVDIEQLISKYVFGKV